VAAWRRLCAFLAGPVVLAILFTAAVALFLLGVHYGTGALPAGVGPRDYDPYPSGWCRERTLGEVDRRTKSPAALELAGLPAVVAVVPQDDSGPSLCLLRCGPLPGETATGVTSRLYLSPPRPTVPSEPRAGVDSSGRMHIVWVDRKGGGSRIRYGAVSRDGEWFADVLLTRHDSGVAAPCLAVGPGDVVHAAWVDLSRGLPAIRYVRIEEGTPRGEAWLSEAGTVNDEPSLDVDERGTTYAAWVESRGAGVERLVGYAAISAGGEVTRRARLEGGRKAMRPLVLAGRDGAVLLWGDRLSGAGAALSGRSLEGVLLSRVGPGSGPGRTVPVVQSPSFVRDVNAWFDGVREEIHLVWMEARTGSRDVFYRKLGKDGGVLGECQRLSTSSLGDVEPAACLDDRGFVYVFWLREDRGERYSLVLRETRNPVPPPGSYRVGLHPQNPCASFLYYLVQSGFNAFLVAGRNALIVVGAALAWHLSGGVWSRLPGTVGLLAVSGLLGLVTAPGSPAFSLPEAVAGTHDVARHLLFFVLATGTSVAYALHRRFDVDNALVKALFVTLWLLWYSYCAVVPSTFGFV